MHTQKREGIFDPPADFDPIAFQQRQGFAEKLPDQRLVRMLLMLDRPDTYMAKRSLYHTHASCNLIGGSASEGSFNVVKAAGHLW